MTSSVAKNWEEVFKHHSAYETADVGKEFFLRYQKSAYVQSMLNFAKIKKGKILEAGCGSGKFSVTLATLGFEVWALDYSDKVLENVKKLAAAAEVFFGPLKLNLLKGDLTNLSLKRNFFDITFNEGVIEHWLIKKERLDVIKQMMSVTKVDGIIAIFVPNGFHPFHKWWVFSSFRGYLTAPQMTLYSVNKLKKEMQEVGLAALESDGFDSYYSINKWPRISLFDYPIGFLEKNIKPPKFFRETFGLNIGGFGKKV